MDRSDNTPQINYRARRRVSLLLRYGILVFWFVICMAPIAVLVMASLKPTALFQTIPDLFTLSGFTLDNYRSAIGLGDYFMHLRNSLIISFTALAVVLVVCTPMAYGITRLRSVRMKSTIMFGVLSTRFIPYVVLALPLFMLFRRIGLSGTLTAVIMAHLAMQMPLIVWLMLGFFSGIPIEVEESAVIDGCTPFQTFRLVVLPMVLPGLNASAILALIISYNEFLFAFFLGGRYSRPLTVGIQRFVGGVDVGAQYGIVAAYGAMIIVPIILFALVANRYIVSGLTQGAVKG